MKVVQNVIKFYIIVSYLSAVNLATEFIFEDILEEVVDIEICIPLIIAHRGASGYVPEHTLGSYALAITLGADYIEPDLVMTKDGYLVACHDNELSVTTDVSKHPEFANRYRTQFIDGQNVTGWFTEDFLLDELKILRALERIPDIRPGNAHLNYAYTIPTLEEIINLVLNMQLSDGRTIGIYPEIKHSSHFKRLGLPMEELLIAKLHKHGYRDSNAPVYIQSLEVTNLKELKKITDLRLMQLFDRKSLQPQDQKYLGTNMTYGDMATEKGLQEIAEYAAAVGPDKSYIIPLINDNTLGTPTSFVQHAHAVGLKVHPYVFRAENKFLPTEFRSDSSDTSFGDLIKELEAYLATGIDGLFTDQPDVLARLRGPCL